MERKARRVGVMCVGILLLSLGIALFKITLMGNDPSTAMVMAIGDRAGVDFSIILLITNSMWFLVELLFARKMIGIGTFVNWLFVGVIASFFLSGINAWFVLPESFAARLGVMAVGILILSLGCALYQTADVGIAPYDAISLIMARHLPVPYFWCRMITDSICAVVAVAFGGIVGLGTLVCALGLGPFISFFTVHVARKLCGNN